MGLGVPFVGHRDQFAVGVAPGDVGEDDAGQHAGMVELLAALLDMALVGEVAQHLFEGGAVRILEAEGAGDFAGADLAGFLADEGEQVFLAGEGVSLGLGNQTFIRKNGSAGSRCPHAARSLASIWRNAQRRFDDSLPACSGHLLGEGRGLHPQPC